MQILPRPNKFSEADVIAYKAHPKGGPTEIWLGQVRRVDLPNTLKVDWFEKEDDDQTYEISDNYDIIKMKTVLAKIKGWKGGEFAPADMEFLQNINL